MCFTPNGQWILALQWDNSVAILDADGKERGRVPPLKPLSVSIDIAKDSKWGVASSVTFSAKPPTDITFFKIPEGEVIKFHTFDKGFWRVLLSPDNRHLYGGSEIDGELFIWEIVNHDLRLVKKFPAHKGGVGGMALSKDGKTLFTYGGNSFKQWSVPEGEQRNEWQMSVISGFGADDAIDVAPDGRHAAIGCQDGRILILRLAAAK